MNEVVKKKADLLLKNRAIISEKYKMLDSRTKTAAALAYTAENKDIDIERFNEADDYIEKNTGKLSEYSVKMRPIIVSRMAMSENPAQYFKDLEMIIEKLKKVSSSELYYRMMVAMDLIDSDRLYEMESLLIRYNDILNRMKKEHPFLTGMEDLVYTMRLTLSDKSVDAIIREMEQCYTYLRKNRKIKAGHDEIQGVSEILTLSNEDVSAKCDKVAELHNAFIEHKAKYGDYYNITASLGVLINLDMDKDALVDEIVELSEYLYPNDGFGEPIMDKKLRLMFAAMLLYDAYNGDKVADEYSAKMLKLHIVITQQVLLTKAIRADQSASDDMVYINAMMLD